MINEKTVLGILRGAIAAIEQLASAPTKDTTPPASGPRLASDSELDSQYGDEPVKFNPRDWTGDNFKGAKMSQTSAAFLDMLADTYAYFAQKNDENHAVDANGRLKSGYDRRSERRARGWAARLRNGWMPAAQKPAVTVDDIPWGSRVAHHVGTMADDDDIPF